MQQVVVKRRGFVFQTGLDHKQIATHAVQTLLVGQGQGSPIVRHGGIEVHQVVAVEDDFLHINFYPAHPQGMKKTKVLAVHGGGFVR